MTLEINVQKIHPNAIIPTYARPDDAGMDITAIGRAITENYIEYKTGLAFEITKGYVCLIFPRSSITKKDLMLKNSVGILDSGYRGELIFRFQKNGEQIYEVGDKIGQIMIIPYPEIKFHEVSELSETARGEDGFGSTGR